MLKTSFTNTFNIESIKSKDDLVALYDRWIAALESGEYKHATGYLRLMEGSMTKKPHMCCLGVLTDICKPNWFPKASDRFDQAYGHDEAGYEAGMPPESIAGITMLDYYIYPNNLGIDTEKDGSLMGCLARVNDESSSYKRVLKIIKKTRDYLASDAFDFDAYADSIGW